MFVLGYRLFFTQTSHNGTMNRNLWLLALAQGLFLTNNVTFIAINGLVGLALAPKGWMATLPVMGYVVGAALFTRPVSGLQARLGRKRSFALGLGVAFFSALLCAYAALNRNFYLLVAATMLAGFYSANASLYRFAAPELAASGFKEKAVSLVLAGGLIGAVAGPNLAQATRSLLDVPFAAAYVALAGVALLGLLVVAFIEFPKLAPAKAPAPIPGQVAAAPYYKRPVFIVAAIGGALSYGVMNLLMAATPIAMQNCGLPFDSAAWVLEWHVIGMFAPGFFTGHLIQRFGALRIMAVGLALNLGCVAIALAGVGMNNFLIALFLLGVGWNFLFTGSTTLAMQGYAPHEKDRAQGTLNFLQFSTLALSSFSSGALVTTQGWSWLNWGSLLPLGVMGLALAWLARTQRSANNPAL
jgi:MFS family permease